MTLEQQVCSKELSIQLEKLGVPQNSLFYWAKDNYNGRWHVVRKGESFRTYTDEVDAGTYYDHISAFTVAELGEMLPVEALDGDILGYIPTQLQICKQDFGWYCVYKNISDGEDEDRDVHECVADTLADCLAKMLIYLLENKL